MTKEEITRYIKLGLYKGRGIVLLGRELYLIYLYNIHYILLIIPI
jgi:hypothetical protein